MKDFFFNLSFFQLIFRFEFRLTESFTKTGNGNPEDNNSINCQHCGVQIPRNYLQHHIDAVHEGEKIVNCHHCLMELPKNQLQCHIDKVHEGEKINPCNLCTKSFNSTSGFKQHMTKAHSGTKSYKCQYCQKIYAHSQRLKTHIKVAHFGLKEVDLKVEENVQENPTTTIALDGIPLVMVHYPKPNGTLIQKTNVHEGKNSDGFG